MRRFQLLILLSVCLAMSCQKNEVFLSLSSEIVEFDSDAGSRVVSITSSGNWEASVSVPWISVSLMYGSSPCDTIIIKCEGNTSSQSRTGVVTITSNGIKKSIVIKQGTEDDSFRLITKRIVEQSLYTPSDSLLMDAIQMMNEDGSYKDIDYDSKAITAWPSNKHYTRLLYLVNAYMNPSSEMFLSQSLFTKIQCGLMYWDKRNPESENWWYGTIEEPQSIGLILLYLSIAPLKIDKSLENSLITKWREKGGTPQSYTGANRTSVALHWFYLSCLTEDHERMMTALEYLYEPIKYTSGEGFQVDGTFFSHGNQLYLGAYAETAMSSVLQVASCMRETEYALNPEKIAILRRFLLDTYAHCIRGQVMNYNCMGRAMSYADFLKNPTKRLSYYSQMSLIDEAFSEEYGTIMKRISGLESASYGLIPVHQHYYRGDYSIHVRQKYNFSVRLCSTRTCRNESGNDENIYTYYLSDGGYTITRHGNEYNNLMPFLNWIQMPGVTTPTRSDIPVTPIWQFYGNSIFAGGVSDQLYGCTAYKYYDTYENVNTGASKGWFFFDDEVVCLGADIHSDYQATTTINQCRANGEYFESEHLAWHDSIGYYLPCEEDFDCKIEHRTGNWHNIATSQPDKELSDDVFSIVINHNSDRLRSLLGDKYAYIIVPGVSWSEFENYVNDCQIELLSNNDSLQAVRHNGLKLTEAIFYQPGTIPCYNGAFSVDCACCVVINEGMNEIHISIADPTWSYKPITVKWKCNDGTVQEYIVDFSELSADTGGKTKNIIITKES